MQPTTYRNRKKGLDVPSSSRDGKSSAASSDTEEHLPAPFRQASKHAPRQVHLPMPAVFRDEMSLLIILSQDTRVLLLLQSLPRLAFFFASTKSITLPELCAWSGFLGLGFQLILLGSFDEVHFGKFASYYILREYYFDVHPPFAKLMLGLAGWFAGFDGHFTFENIGDSYTDAHVPYVGIRALPALFGSLTIPLVYAIMRESGYPTIVAAFTTSIVLFGILSALDLGDSHTDNIPR